jgi:transposase
MARRAPRRSTDEHEAAAIAPFQSSGKTIPQVCRALDLAEKAVREWIKQGDVDGGKRAGLPTASAPNRCDSARKVECCKEERTILKTAAVKCSRQTR